jgi:hypothetical protein
MTNAPYEVIFHRYFSKLTPHLRELYRGRLNMSEFEIQELVLAFEGIRDEINSRWENHAAGSRRRLERSSCIWTTSIRGI